jgi:ribitol 2-dehydrogenase
MARAREPMRVALTARSSEKLNSLSSELGSETIVLPADLTEPDRVDWVIDSAITRLGRLDVLFLNAGVYIAGDVADGDPDGWDRLLMLNVNSVFRAIRRVLPHMRHNEGGDILVTSSISAHQIIPFEPVYGASKHAVNAFLYALRRQVIGTTFESVQSRQARY